MHRVPTKTKPDWKWLSSLNTICLSRLDNEWNTLSCFWAIFWTDSGVVNIVNKKALRRKYIPILKSPSLWTLQKTEKAEGIPSVLFFHGEKKKVTSNREYNHPAVLFWTDSSSVVLCMLNSSIKYSMQYSMQNLIYLWIFLPMSDIKNERRNG